MRLAVVSLLATATIGAFAAEARETAPPASAMRVDRAPDPVTTGSLPRPALWRADLDQIEVAFRRTLPEIERLSDPAE